MNVDLLGRRQFVAGAFAAASGLSCLEGAEPKTKFPTEARRRLAVSTYSFRSLISTPNSQGAEQSRRGMKLEDFAGTVTAKLNVTGVEPWSDHFESTNPKYLNHLAQSFRKAGLHVVNIPVDVGVVQCSSAEQRQQGLSVYEKWIDAAVILGSPSIRVHLPHGEQGEQIQCSVDSLKALANYGQSKNIVVNLENDEPSIEQPERIARVITKVSSPYLRALPDFCNSMLIHNDEEYNNAGLRKLFPLAFNISHVKSMESDEGRVVRVNVDKIFEIAKKANYRGYFSIEWEGTGDPYQETGELISASIRNLS